MPHTGEFSHCSIVKSDEAPLAELAEVGGEDIVLNGEFGPLGRRAVDIGPFGEGAGPLHQPIRSDLEEVLAISLSSGFKTPATQAGAVLHLDVSGTIGLPDVSDDGWVVPGVSAHLRSGRAGCWHEGFGRQLDYLPYGPVVWRCSTTRPPLPVQLAGRWR